MLERLHHLALAHSALRPMTIVASVCGPVLACSNQIPDAPATQPSARDPESTPGPSHRPETVEAIAGEPDVPLDPESADGAQEAIAVNDSSILAEFPLEGAGLDFLLLAEGQVVAERGDSEQWRGAVLAVRKTGEPKAHPWLTLQLDAFADEYSLHIAPVLAEPPLFDLRVNTHHGEDNWSTDVEAFLVRNVGIDQHPVTVWQGTEDYSGVLDICTTMNGVNYEADAERGEVELVRFKEQIYSPSQDGDRERVPKKDCPPRARKETRQQVWPAQAELPPPP